MERLLQWSHAGFPRRVTLLAQKGKQLYTEDTTSGITAAQASLPGGVLHSIRHMELDKLSGRTTVVTVLLCLSVLKILDSKMLSSLQYCSCIKIDSQ